MVLATTSHAAHSGQMVYIGTLHDLYIHTMGTELCIARTGICCLAKYKHALLQ